jgi:dihydrofolate reductase
MIGDARLAFIVAMDENRVIGRDGGLPWRLPDDMRWFRRHTTGKPCIMGRKTYESLPPQFRPLPDRLNIVITRDPAYRAPGAVVVHTIEDALSAAAGAPEIMVIGGGEVFRQLLPQADRLYLTLVEAQGPGDVTFPATEPGEWVEEFCQEHPADDRHEVAFIWQIVDRYRSPDSGEST